MPKADPANPEKHVDFVGYARIPGLRDTVAVVAQPAIQPAPVPVPSAAPAAKVAQTDELREPPRGNPERKAIMDALRAEKFPGQEDKVIFVVKHLKIHNGWAWTDVTPQDHQGKAVGDGTTALMHFEDGKWKSVDLGKLPELSKHPTSAKGTSLGFVKNLLELYPGVPSDIFPTRRE
jgi:hypothetical protein